MEEKQRKELIKKIIEEQDIVALYTYDGFNKSLGIMQEYSKGILYSGLKKFILQNSEMLKKFTTKNLYTLLACFLSFNTILYLLVILSKIVVSPTMCILTLFSLSVTSYIWAQLFVKYHR